MNTSCSRWLPALTSFPLYSPLFFFLVVLKLYLISYTLSSVPIRKMCYVHVLFFSTQKVHQHQERTLCMQLETLCYRHERNIPLGEHTFALSLGSFGKSGGSGRVSSKYSIIGSCEKYNAQLIVMDKTKDCVW